MAALLSSRQACAADAAPVKRLAGCASPDHRHPKEAELLDGYLRSRIEPALDAAGRRLAKAGVGANAVTWTGFAIGAAAALCIARGHFLAGLVLILASRLCDGLDGAVARAGAIPGKAAAGFPSGTAPERSAGAFPRFEGRRTRAGGGSDFGGFLDITLDFAFYGLIPLAFVIADPAENAIAGAALIAAFYANGASFLAYAVMAEKRGMKSRARGEKSLFFTTGLAEASETLATFAAFCLFPAWFSPLAWLFTAITVYTTVSRIVLARREFG